MNIDILIAFYIGGWIATMVPTFSVAIRNKKLPLTYALFSSLLWPIYLVVSTLWAIGFLKMEDKDVS